MNKEKVYFKIDGEWITNFIRTLYFRENKPYEECSRNLAKILGIQNSSKDEIESVVQPIIFGDKKLVGINTVEIEDDNDFNVYDYAKFKEPKYSNEDIGKGLRGILTREGLFISCGYMEHNYTIRKIGEERAKGSIAIWKSSSSNGVSLDKLNDRITPYQEKWYKKNSIYLNDKQRKNWEAIKERELISLKYEKSRKERGLI